jgi:hypothetical protein
MIAGDVSSSPAPHPVRVTTRRGNAATSQRRHTL